MEFSIVIPAFNEEKRLPRTLDTVIRFLARANYESYEIVIVDDGSTDQTVVCVEKAIATYGNRIRLIRHTENKGRGGAVRTGVLAAEGEYILETDADGSVDEEAFLRFLNVMKARPELGVVIGSRRMPGAEILTPQPLLRVIMGYGFVYLSKLLISPSITDFSLGYKMFRRDACKDIFKYQVDNRYLAEAEIIYISEKRGWGLIQQPIRWTDYRDSRVRPFKDALRTLKGYVGIFRRAMSGFYLKGLLTKGREIGDYDTAAKFVKTLYRGHGWPSLFARIRFWTAPYKALVPLIPNEGTIVDIGCGYGLFGNLLGLMSAKRNVIGFDTDKVKMKYADRGVGNATFRSGDAMQMEDGAADTFLLIHVLHHLKSFDEQASLLAKIRSKLREGGKLIICEIDTRPFWKFVLTKLTDHGLYPGDRIFYRTPEKLVPLLEANGFEVTSQPMHEGTPYSHVTYVCRAVSGRPVPHATPRAKDDTFALLAWWIGIPVLTFASVFAPYWIWNIVHHVAPFWRTPIFQGAMFDITWYLPLTGAVQAGYNYGGFLHWFHWPLLLLWKIMKGASVPEVWFASRWIMTTIGIWVGSWCFRKWAPISVSASRFLSLCFWFSLVLALGMRPGIYGWWLPFCMLGFTLVRAAAEDLQASRVARAFVLCVLALPLTWLYTWFFMIVAIWIGVMWSLWLLRKRPNMLLGFLLLGLAIIPFVGFALANGLSTPHADAVRQMYERIGLAYTRMPYLTNSFVIVPGFIVLLLCFPHLRRLTARGETLLAMAMTSWIVMFFGWQFSPFMGIALDNDHQRVPVVVLSWFTFAALWTLLRDKTLSEPSESARFRKLALGSSFVVLALSLVYIYHILSSFYVFHDEYLNVLHLSHWFILALSAWCVFRYSGAKRVIPSAWMPALVFVVSVAGGVSAAAHIYRNELVKLPSATLQLPLMDYLRATVPSQDAVCSDPEEAAFMGIHIARKTHPTVMTKFLQQTDAEAIQTLITISSAYDVVGAGYLKSFKRFVRMDRYIPCASYDKIVPILRRVGVSDAKIDQWIGCPRATLDVEQQVFQNALDHRVLDTQKFEATCPWVVVPTAQKSFWRFPTSYKELKFSDDVSIWSPKLK